MRLLCSIDNGGGSAYYAARDKERGNMHSPLLVHLVTSLLLALMGIGGWCEQPSVAAKTGGFPGKGSYQAWLSANKSFNRGTDLLKASNYAAASQHFQKAIALYGFDADYYHNLGVAQKKLKKWEAAEQSFKTALKFNPAKWNSWDSLGRLHYDRGRLKDAKLAFEKALQSGPPSTERTTIENNLRTVSRELSAVPALAQP